LPVVVEIDDGTEQKFAERKPKGALEGFQLGGYQGQGVLFTSKALITGVFICPVGSVARRALQRGFSRL
jgi:hypothetical protein